jgi:type II secretory pathway pseudopilin PulG
VPAWQLVAQIVAFVVIVIVAVVGIVQWRRADRLSSQRNDRLNASQAAGAFAEALLTYDSANPTATLTRLKTMATTSYQPKIEQARSSALSGPAQQNKTTSTAHVENTYITEVDGNSADAVCQTSWLVSSAGQTAPAVDFYLKVALKRQGGSWKIDNVAGLAAVQPPGAAAPSPSPSPSSTVPGTVPGG